MATISHLMHKIKTGFLRRKVVETTSEKPIIDQQNVDTLHDMITNPPQAVKDALEYIFNSEEVNRSKNSMIELNNYYYKYRDTISKDLAQKIAVYQDQVLVEYGFNVNPTLRNAFDYGDRAIAKAELNDPIGAIEDFDKAIQLNPEYENAYVWRGEEKYKIYNFQDAISDYQQAIKLNPDNSEAFLNLGKAKLKLKRFDEAIADAQKAKDLGNEKAEQLIKEIVGK